MKLPAEIVVDELPPQVEHELTARQAIDLLESGRYHPATGMYRGRHLRRSRGRGCYHLRIVGRRAWLHWDVWDPRRHPLRHALETPEITTTAPLGLGALAVAIARALR